MKKFNRNVNPQSIEAYAKVCQLVSCPGCSGCSCGPEFGILGYNKIASNSKGYPSSYVTENN